MWMKELREYYVLKVRAKPLESLVLLGNVHCCRRASPPASNLVLPTFCSRPQKKTLKVKLLIAFRWMANPVR